MAISLSSIFFFLQLFAGTFALNWRLTAISANSRQESILECWELCTPISISSTPGISGAALQALGPITSASAATLPPYYDAGLHKAPAAQFVAFASGLAQISLPCSSMEATIKGGKYGLIFAADTASVSKLGHITKYPSGEQTLALMFPAQDGKIPVHRVLHPGQCTQEELDVVKIKAS